jgi:hypothetical protein
VIICTKQFKIVRLKSSHIMFTVTDTEKCIPIVVHRNYKLIPWNCIFHLNC